MIALGIANFTEQEQVKRFRGSEVRSAECRSGAEQVQGRAGQGRAGAEVLRTRRGQQVQHLQKCWCRGAEVHIWRLGAE